MSCVTQLENRDGRIQREYLKGEKKRGARAWGQIDELKREEEGEKETGEWTIRGRGTPEGRRVNGERKRDGERGRNGARETDEE